MIKYLELTAPESMELRSAKILSTDVAEGDTVKKGDTLFTIINNGKEVPLPATMDGRIMEIIVADGDGISVLTPLVLFETNVKGEPKKESKTTPDTPPARNKNIVTVKVPDIGGDAAKVVEILVKVGDSISVDDPIVTLESDKASMEVPSTAVGTVHAIKTTIGHDASEGDALIEIMRGAAGGAVADPSEKPELQPEPASAAPKSASDASTSYSEIEVTIPDIGSDSAKVVEILVKKGDTVAIDDALITLESDKASMEVPSSSAGEVLEIKVKLDQEVSAGSVVALLKTQSDGASVSGRENSSVKAEEKTEAPAAPNDKAETAGKSEPKSDSTLETPSTPIAPAQPTKSAGASHASPSIRRLARELGADLAQISGSGRKNRVTKDDVKVWVKQQLQSGSRSTTSAAENTGGGIPVVNIPDFSKFGSTSRQPLSRIKQLTAQNLHRSWLNVPHVTHNDEANITDLESFRKQLNEEIARAKSGVKLSPLAFIVKAVVKALQKYPQFNSSLSEDGKELILKEYYNIGIAVDTPEGLVVPVIKAANTLSVSEIANEMGELAAKARDKKLTMSDMSGACFTISSLGGIGGTGFTPIVNAPEVAILGVSRTKIQPHWDGKEFVPAPFLPLNLSYDHRVIDGAEAARFARQIASLLEDVPRLTV